MKSVRSVLFALLFVLSIGAGSSVAYASHGQGINEGDDTIPTVDSSTLQGDVGSSTVSDNYQPEAADEGTEAYEREADGEFVDTYADEEGSEDEE